MQDTGHASLDGKLLKLCKTHSDWLIENVLSEREACATEAEDEMTLWEEGQSGWAACNTIANRIRNRTK